LAAATYGSYMHLLSYLAALMGTAICNRQSAIRCRSRSQLLLSIYHGSTIKMSLCVAAD